ncbi:HlyC/CorC family transporter [Flexivirga sp. ID2601S]|uniref:HlyC/CorC family transporter n=1 Tax=Flexivirga aerilata TaxID=1656889 RepID=A0A849AWE4_9MICO|nr:HlyC/CorC family transporter [Flexivirga aerilata]
MGNWIALGFAVVLLLLNAFFVGAEFALISARRSAVEPHARAGSRAARIAVGAMEQVSLMMATAQLGITLASLGLGALGEPAVAHLMEPVFHALGMPESVSTIVAFVIALAIVVFLHVVLGEMIPKNIALAGPDRAALWLTPPLVLISRLLWPFVVSLNALANLVLRILRVEPKDEVSSTFNRDQVGELVAESRREGLLDDAEQALLAGALGFEEQTVADAMVPMDRVVTVPASASRSRVEQIAADAGYSRLPVVPGTGGLPVGYLHLKDLLILDGDDTSETVPASLLRPLPRLDRSDDLGAAMEMMQQRQVHLALVTDGATPVGLLALEDVLSRLIGRVGA